MEQAKSEIDESLKFSTFCMRRIGLSFESPKKFSSLLFRKCIFLISLLSISYHVISDFLFLGYVLSNSPRLEDVVPILHPFGYAILSISKILSLWSKMDVYSQLLKELAEIWPTTPVDEAKTIKIKSLSDLHQAHKWYFIVTIIGISIYILTPIVSYLLQLLMEGHGKVGFIWITWYPFDKNQTIPHIAVYIFEMFIGLTCVWIMVSTDLLFSGMASHISMLLKMLQYRLQSFGTARRGDQENYQEIISIIKLHQRLIRYCNDLEDVFSFPNLMNVMLSSVNICCVLFVIVLLEPLLVLSSKLFLMSALIEMAMLCWYADEVFHANEDLATAAYNSGWYTVDLKCRKLLLMLMRRAQKPLAFTAMKFTNISLVTYFSILTRSYSYFALLYTVYRES